MGRAAAYSHNSGEDNSDSEMQGVRVVGVDAPVGNFVPAGDITIQLKMVLPCAVSRALSCR